MKIKTLLLYIIILLSFYTCAQDKNQKNFNHSYEIIVQELDIPWGFTFLPDGSILITERDGMLIHFKNSIKTKITNLPKIYVRGQGGLMDIKLHPNYIENGWIYFTYASPEGNEKGGNTALMRAKIKNNALVEKEVLYKASPNSTNLLRYILKW